MLYSTIDLDTLERHFVRLGVQTRTLFHTQTIHARALTNIRDKLTALAVLSISLSAAAMAFVVGDAVREQQISQMLSHLLCRIYRGTNACMAKGPAECRISQSLTTTDCSQHHHHHRHRRIPLELRQSSSSSNCLRESWSIGPLLSLLGRLLPPVRPLLEEHPDTNRVA